MAEEAFHIGVSEGQTVTAVRTFPETGLADWLFIYAPGAGSDVRDPFGTYACDRLAAEGIEAVRFQFPYKEAGKRRPDRTGVLEETWRSAIESLRSTQRRLVVGGRSMGGRIASQVVAQGASADALALFAYPLHHPGSPSRWRDGHFAEVELPTLFCSGTRYTFATPDELRLVASRLSPPEIHLLDGADHGFRVLKSSGRTRADVWAEAVQATLGWLRAL